MIKIYLIKTQHCPKCVNLQLHWENFKNLHKDLEFKEIVFGENPKDDAFVRYHNIQTAPCIIIDNGEVKGLYFNVLSLSSLEHCLETFTKGKEDGQI